MIPFKYYIQIYKRYIKLSIQNKKQNIKEWFAKSKKERYKYFNPDKEKIAYNTEDSVITTALFNTTTIGSNMMDKIYCKDVNRQMHYTKGRLQIIINTLNSIFNKPFNNFIIIKNTHKSIEELAANISKSTNRVILYFLLSLGILFIVILLFNINGINVEQNTIQETSNTIKNTSQSGNNGTIIFFCIILAVIGIYVVITLLISIIFSIVTFICLWKFVNKNTRIILTF